MKRSSVHRFTIIAVTCILMQSCVSVAQNQQYYAVIPNPDYVSQLTITNDSVISKRNVRGYGVSGYRTSIAKVVRKGNYEFVITKAIENVIGHMTLQYRIIVIKDYDPINYCHVISEITRYNTAAECEEAVDKYQPESKFYFTYFTKTDMDKFKTYKNLSSLNVLEQQELFKKFTHLALENKPLIMNTKTGDIYGTVTITDIWTKTAIANHINPLVTEDELNDFVSRNSKH